MDGQTRARLRASVGQLVREAMGGGAIDLYQEEEVPTADGGRVRVGTARVYRRAGDRDLPPDPPLPPTHLLALDVLVGELHAVPQALAAHLAEQGVVPVEAIAFAPPELERVGSIDEWAGRLRDYRNRRQYRCHLVAGRRLVRRAHGRPLGSLDRHIETVYEGWTGLRVPCPLGQSRGHYPGAVPTERFFARQVAAMPNLLRVLRHIRAARNGGLLPLAAGVLARCIATLEGGEAAAGRSVAGATPAT